MVENDMKLKVNIGQIRDNLPVTNTKLVQERHKKLSGFLI